MRRLLIIILAGLLVFSSLTTTIGQQQQTREYTIIYDEAHNQYITADMFKTALSSLNETFDQHFGYDVQINVITQTDRFNSTNIQGSDLVIISNPGMENGSLPNIADPQQTQNVLKNYVDIGGSILYMSNPYSTNPNITGHARPLEDLMFTDFDVSLRTSGTSDQSDNDNTTVILDEFNHKKNNSFVKIKPKNINSETIRTETNDLEASDAEFLYYGASLQKDSPRGGDIEGNTSTYAYSVLQDFEYLDFQESPKWMFARDFGGAQGRTMLIGSTIMFSDLPFDSTSTWIEQSSNKALFQNIAAWLLEITPLPEQNQIVTEGFEFFIRTNLIATLAGSVGILVAFFGYFIYRGRIEMSEIFEVFKLSRKEKSKSKSSSEKESQPKRKSHRERRKRT